MNIKNEREVKDYILDLEKDDFPYLEKLSADNFDLVASPLFNALYLLLKKYKTTKDDEKIDLIINLIEEGIDNSILASDQKTLAKARNLIGSFNYKIGINLDKKDRILINEYQSRINELFIKLSNLDNVSKKGLRR